MDLASLVGELLVAVAEAGWLEHLDLQVAGRIASGRVLLAEQLVIHFFFNGETWTRSFALVYRQKRVWGVDFDNRRGWHRHPFGATEQHVAISPMSVTEIVRELITVLQTFRL